MTREPVSCLNSKPCENVTISQRITLHWTCELDGPKGKLESYHMNEAVLNERTRVESLEHVRICELNGQRKLVSSLKDKPADEDSESKIIVENHLRYKFRPVILYWQ